MVDRADSRLLEVIVTKTDEKKEKIALIVLLAPNEGLDLVSLARAVSGRRVDYSVGRQRGKTSLKI